jgi:hypothetical protein
LNAPKKQTGTFSHYEKGNCGAVASHWLQEQTFPIRI